MKTPLQELIEWLDKRIEDCNEIGGLEIAKWAFIQAKKEATELLEKEQVQLEPTNQDKVREAAEKATVKLGKIIECSGGIYNIDLQRIKDELEKALTKNK